MSRPRYVLALLALPFGSPWLALACLGPALALLWLSLAGPYWMGVVFPNWAPRGVPKRFSQTLLSLPEAFQETPEIIFFDDLRE